MLKIERIMIKSGILGSLLSNQISVHEQKSGIKQKQWHFGAQQNHGCNIATHVGPNAIRPSSVEDDTCQLVMTNMSLEAIEIPLNKLTM